MNKIRGILKQCVHSGQICRLEVQSGDFTFFVLLVEDFFALEHYMNQEVWIFFKETNVVVARNIEGISNTFFAKILSLESDLLFTRLFLECQEAENGNISVLTTCEFGKGLEVGEILYWHILESEIAFLGKC
ncbi:MAG: molybdate ABC transporter [Helicobacter sp.]|nr:molybdate ABC transporter [Helicobacter sp.]